MRLRHLIWLTVVLLLTTAAVVLPTSGATRPTSHAASCYLLTAPVILPEPAYTRGESNTIRWEHVPQSCWLNKDALGNDSTDRRFKVTITNLATNQTTSVTVNGEDEVDATIDANELPRGPNGEIDGVRFQYIVTRKEKYCSGGFEFPEACTSTATQTSRDSDPVRSTQDTRRPSGTLELAGGVSFVRTLSIAGRVTATDPGGAGGSGPGYVELDSSPQFGTCKRSCIQSLDAPVTVQLESGPDGMRTVQARIYDRARRPADDPGVTAIGTPPGNVSLPFSDTVILDTKPPTIFVSVSTVRATVGVPVTVDASRSVDVGGTGADSGVDPSGTEWTFGDGTAKAVGLVARHTYTAPGTFLLTLAVPDRVGNVRRLDLGEIVVVSMPVPPEPRTTSTPTPPTPAPKQVDSKAPLLSQLSVRKVGGRIVLTLRASERGTLVVEARRLSPRPQRTVGSLKRPIRAGRQALTLPAAVARRLRAPGSYRLTLAIRDAAGNKGRVRFVTLRTR